MSEQLGFEQRLGDARAIDSDVLGLFAGGFRVDVPRDQIFPRAALASNQDLGSARRGSFGVGQQLTHLRIGDDEVWKSLVGLQLFRM